MYYILIYKYQWLLFYKEIDKYIDNLYCLSHMIQEIYTKILGEVVKNEDSLVTSHVDGGVTGIAHSMLQDGPW